MRALARPVVVVVATLAELFGAAPRSVQAQANGSIRGKVVSRVDQHAIADARVSVVGADRTAATNQQGEFAIADLPAGTYEVRARLIGYGEGTDTVTVAGGEVATANFSLEPKALALDAVAVTALGIERSKRETPYAISGVSDTDVTKASPSTVPAALYGEVPGLK